MWIVAFVVAPVMDILLLLYAIISKNNILLLFMMGAAVGGIVMIQKVWNKDERTDKAIDLASRNAIKIFLTTILTIGISLLAASYLYEIPWEMGATFIISAIFLAYLQMILAVTKESEMR